MPGGEAIKNDLTLVEGFMRLMLETHMDRQSFIIIVGGGAVMDAVGLAAALVHRGLRQVRVPTTVLGQNDAGVGVKNGVNFMGGKNAIGTFAPPFAVLNDFDFLVSLPAARLALRRRRGVEGRDHPRPRILRLARGECSEVSRARHRGDGISRLSLRRGEFTSNTSARMAILSSMAARARSISATGPRTSWS